MRNKQQQASQWHWQSLVGNTDAVGDFLLKVNCFLFAPGEPRRRLCWELIARGVYLDVQVGGFISSALMVPSQASQHDGVSIPSPLHSASHLLQKQRFINDSHLSGSCTRARARVAVD